MPFEKGKSGNPGGRRKEKKVRDALVKLLADLDEGNDDLRSLLKVWRKIYDKALEGDLAAAKEMFDRHDGKVPQPIAGSDDETDPPVKIIHEVICKGWPQATKTDEPSDDSTS